MKSGSLTHLYKKWQATAAVPQIAFVDAVYAMCEEHYEAGGDTIVECYDPEDILREFNTLDEVREWCGLKVEQATNARWGEDDDPEIERSERFHEWEDEDIDHGCKDDNHFFGRE